MSKILITGATSFIAREIIAKLISQGHQITAFARKGQFIKRIFPTAKVITGDFDKMLSARDWHAYLNNIDVVINCVGIFQTRDNKAMWNIHYYAPQALFDACVAKSVKQIIQLSALGIEKVKASYSESKLACEEYLTSLSIDSVIVKPSVVYGSGSYGGTSFFRGLAGFPFFLFLPGKGKQQVQPIHVHDLAQLFVEYTNKSGKHQLYAVGKQKLTLKTLLNLTRRWLGFKPAKNISVPMPLLKLSAKIADLFRNSPLSTTTIKMLERNNVAETTNVQSEGFEKKLFCHPSQVQDRWHARLYFIRPFLRLSLALLWIWTAVVSLWLFPLPQSYALLNQANVSPILQPALLYASSSLDGLLGLALLSNYRVQEVGIVQIFLLIFYSIFTLLFMPTLWLHPLTPLAKNIPLIFATWVMIAIQDSR